MRELTVHVATDVVKAVFIIDYGKAFVSDFVGKVLYKDKIHSLEISASIGNIIIGVSTGYVVFYKNNDRLSAMRYDKFNNLIGEYCISEIDNIKDKNGN